MYAIRLELLPPPAGEGCPDAAGPGPVRTALLRLPLEGARVCHARVHGGVRLREGVDGLAAVCFLAAPSLLAAEWALRAGTAGLVGPGGPLAGWSVARCEADPWIALGRWQDRARS
ncbi:hypothetical protein HUT16_21115 [Kitasatospora sp. NA04385]|uniref:hypothetical protein n=1 Tax=Kitasatospora sp. NA04385 TaxID=2742135 RepID=UPI0015928DBE|nr:hypothetical protein [Kitasatospora sp. NA04385]QKW21229.1 hypothetical protein HUT16_21115 [Kitasatospora sp. NA04385]